MKLFDYFNLISGFSSITGFSILGTFRYFKSKTRNLENAKFKHIVKICTITTSSIFILSMLLTYKPWNEIHFGDEKQTAKHDTIVIVEKINTPAKKDNSEVSLKYKKNTNKNFKSEQPHISNSDTGSRSKYDLSHATLSQSAVGDNAKVENNYNGLIQRHVQDSDVTNILNTLNELFRLHPDLIKNRVDIIALTDFESRIVTNELQAKLEVKGFKVIFNPGINIPYNPIGIQVVYPGLHNWAMIQINPAKNSN